MKIFFITTLAVLGTSLCPAWSATASDSSVYSQSIQALGGKVVDVARYPQSVAGFEAYLADSGVKLLNAQELTKPNHPEIARRLGFQDFLPQRSWWERGAALALLTQSIETATKAEIRLRNWWRPAAYNADPGVKGAKDGDHPTANAVDLDYHSVAQRMAAERFLRALDRKCPWMHLSLGLGAQTTHVGIASPRGHREWHYAGWQPAAGSSVASD